jgi:hypothetical protein
MEAPREAAQREEVVGAGITREFTNENGAFSARNTGGVDQSIFNRHHLFELAISSQPLR